CRDHLAPVPAGFVIVLMEDDKADAEDPQPRGQVLGPMLCAAWVGGRHEPEPKQRVCVLLALGYMHLSIEVDEQSLLKGPQLVPSFALRVSAFNAGFPPAVASPIGLEESALALGVETFLDTEIELLIRVVVYPNRLRGTLRLAFGAMQDALCVLIRCKSGDY